MLELAARLRVGLREAAERFLDFGRASSGFGFARLAGVRAGARDLDLPVLRFAGFGRLSRPLRAGFVVVLRAMMSL